MNARKPMGQGPRPDRNHYHHDWYWRHYYDWPYDYYDDWYDYGDYDHSDYLYSGYSLPNKVQQSYQQGFAHGVKHATAIAANPPMPKAPMPKPPIAPTPKSEGEE